VPDEAADALVGQDARRVPRVGDDRRRDGIDDDARADEELLADHGVDGTDVATPGPG
jgi:hypothetical protein